ncbi:MAG TPA: SBBP repeat-containing protein [Thermoanaerobaculia bacterium]|nr:SBBP repeat-containing protein [Thermoanaerobaculia bacterium]
MRRTSRYACLAVVSGIVLGGGSSRAAVLEYSTYLGGGGFDEVHAIAVDAAGNAYVTGRTLSPGFPASGVLHPGMDLDAFSSYLGGSDNDDLGGLAIDSGGRVALTGRTFSADFPLRDALFSRASGSLYDAFVTRLAPGGSGILFSSLLGGTFWAEGRAVATDGRGNVYVTGNTGSADFPAVHAAQPVFAGGDADAFVTKISFNQSPVCAAAFASPATLWPPNGKLVPVSIRGVTDPDGDSVTLRATGVRQDEPLQGAQNAFGIGTSSVQLRADRAGGGDGRVYRITFEASDGNGGACTGTVTVCVPHDQGVGKVCGDGGPLFPSGG